MRLLGLFVPFFRLCGSPCVVVSSTCRPFRPIYAESQPHHTKHLSSLQHLHTLGSCPSCSLGQSSPQLPSAPSKCSCWAELTTAPLRLCAPVPGAHAALHFLLLLHFTAASSLCAHVPSRQSWGSRATGSCSPFLL